MPLFKFVPLSLEEKNKIKREGIWHYTNEKGKKGIESTNMLIAQCSRLRKIKNALYQYSYDGKEKVFFFSERPSNKALSFNYMRGIKNACVIYPNNELLEKIGKRVYDGVYAIEGDVHFTFIDANTKMDDEKTYGTMKNMEMKISINSVFNLPTILNLVGLILLYCIEIIVFCLLIG